MSLQKEIKKIVIIDFGSQITKLIARRIRDLGVYSEIVTLKNFIKLKNFENIKGLIFSGGPATVTKKNFPNLPHDIFQKKIPILGICYGLQLITKTFKGLVSSGTKKREFGRALLLKKKKFKINKKFFF